MKEFKMTTRTHSTKSKHWDFPKFTFQDQNLLEAYHRVMKFQLTKPCDVKAGIVVNVRDTYMLQNCLVETVVLKGYAMKDSSGVMKFHDAEVCRKLSHFHNSAALWTTQHNLPIKSKAQKKEAIGGVGVDSLIKRWMSFNYNAKVIEFTKLLEKADRFQQHCIIKGKPYNEQTYQNWVEMVDYDRWMCSKLLEN